MILFLVLFPIITQGCKSLEGNNIVFPPKPERKEIKNPESAKDYALIIAYYESLVEEWETWGETVEEQLK